MNDLHLAPETLDRRALLRALRALKKGDFTMRLPLDLTGIDGQIAECFNDIVAVNESIRSEIASFISTMSLKTSAICPSMPVRRSERHTTELQSQSKIVSRLLL